MSIILVSGYKVPDISWKMLVPQTLNYKYQCERPNKNPLLPSKLNKILPTYIMPNLLENESFSNIIEIYHKKLKNIPKPHIFICHSLGFLVGLYYLDKYPAEIFKLVNIDGTIPTKDFNCFGQKNLQRDYHKILKVSPDKSKIISLINITKENQSKTYYYNNISNKVYIFKNKDHLLYHIIPDFIVELMHQSWIYKYR